MSSASLWEQTMPAEARVDGVPLPGDVDVDVAIVGAGLTGIVDRLLPRLR